MSDVQCTYIIWYKWVSYVEISLFYARVRNIPRQHNNFKNSIRKPSVTVATSTTVYLLESVCVCVFGDYVAGTSFSRQFATRFRRPKVLINHFVNYVGLVRMCCLSAPQHHQSLFYGTLKIVLLELYIVTMGSSGIMQYDGPISGLHVYLTCFALPTPAEPR